MDDLRHSAGVQPLVTIALFGCNQERYIAEAVKGALSQTYSPLEIILTDDASQDGTFETMADLAGGYDGPHAIQVRQNERRLGLVGSLNEVARIARGELLAIAAGDDISLPHRVTDTVKAWICGDRTDYSLHSAMFTMDKNSRVKGPKLEPPPHTWNLARWEDRPMAIKSGSQKGDHIVGLVRNLRYVYGASQTVHRDLFQRFGPIDPAIIHEDIVLPFRASLLGGIRFIERPLGIYREHSQGISQVRRSRLEATVVYARHRIPICQQMLRDLDVVAFPDRTVAAEAARMEERMQLMYDLHTCGFGKRPAHVARALRRGVGVGYCARQFIKASVLAAVN